MPETSVSFIGGDLRQEYMAEDLKKQGYQVTVYGFQTGQFNWVGHTADNLSEAMNKSRILIGPIPFSKGQNEITSKMPVPDLNIKEFFRTIKNTHIVFGGCFSDSVKEMFEENAVRYFDFMEMEEVCIKNAIATAEGAITEAMLASPITLHKSKCLVLGYGRCGKVLADRLLGMKAMVTVSDRKVESCALAGAYGCESIGLSVLAAQIGEFDFIFNTIPALVLTQEKLLLTKNEVCIIDLASKPGGVDFIAAKELNRKAYLRLSLPGIYAPKSAAHILNDAFMKVFATVHTGS